MIIDVRNLIEWVVRKMFPPREMFLYYEEEDILMAVPRAFIKEREKQYKKQQRQEKHKERKCIFQKKPKKMVAEKCFRWQIEEAIEKMELEK